MAEIAHLTITMEEDDPLLACSIGATLETLTVGMTLDDVSLWTRAGFDNALKDCVRLHRAVDGMIEKLLDAKRAAEVEAAEEEEATRMDLDHDQDEEAAAEGADPE